MTAATVTCPRCRGAGEVVARSRYVGDGAYNDDYDVCPRCWGNGYVRLPEHHEQTAQEQPVEVAK